MSPDTPYPVMVWFHGGGYVGGGNIQYPGHFLASHDVVVVVPNYRLNVFGQCTHGGQQPTHASRTGAKWWNSRYMLAERGPNGVTAHTCKPNGGQKL